MTTYYLNEDYSYRQADLMEWADQFEAMDRRLKVDKLYGHKVSTVWLGYDHNHFDGPPLLFETMIFLDEFGGNDIYCDRYTTWEEALNGHAKAVHWLKSGIKDDNYT